MIVFFKRLSLLCFILHLLITIASGQSSQGFRYQADVKDYGEAISEKQTISVKISIFLKNSENTPLYCEVNKTTINNTKIIDIQIGQGKVISGDFTNINWNKDVHYISVEIDTHNNGNYKFLKKEQLPSYYKQINEGIVLDQKQHSGKSSPHTLSVVRPNPNGKYNGHTYWGYVGEATGGNIDLRFSEDLLTWEPYKNNPIITGNAARWPSVLFEGGYFYMAHTIKFGGDSSLVLRKSTDGIRFLFYNNLTETKTEEATRNPFLFKDTNSNNFYLLYKRWKENISEIRIKEATTPEELSKAAYKVILARFANTIAAPSMFYANKRYWLLTEGNEKPWAVEAYASSNPTGPFIENPSGWILTNDDACPFPYIEGKILYNYICHRDDGTIWKIGLVKSDLSPDNGN